MLKKFLNLSFVALLLSGCTGRKDMDFPPNFLSQPSSIVITKISGLDEPYLHKMGQQGLLEVVINEAMTDSVGQKVQGIDASDVLEEKYYKLFDQGFNKYNFKVVNDHDGLHKEGLADANDSGHEFAPHDFAILKRRFSTDYALIMHPVAFGASRQYYGFIPLGAPKGYAHVYVYLVNLATNKLAGYYNSVVTVAVKGDWDTPPDYQILIDACKKALADALDNAYGYFFIGK